MSLPGKRIARSARWSPVRGPCCSAATRARTTCCSASPRACRQSTIEGADDMVGLFINTLPFRASVPPDDDGVYVAGRSPRRSRSPSASTSTRRLRGCSRGAMCRAARRCSKRSSSSRTTSSIRCCAATAAPGSTPLRVSRPDEFSGRRSSATPTRICCCGSSTDRQALDAAIAAQMLQHVRRLLEGLAKDGHRLPRRDPDARRRRAGRAAAGPAAVRDSDILPARALRAACGRNASRGGADVRRPDADLRGAQSAGEPLAHRLRALGVCPDVLGRRASRALGPTSSSRFSGS